MRFHTAEDLDRLAEILTEGKNVMQNLEISADLKQGRVFKRVTQYLIYLQIFQLADLKHLLKSKKCYRQLYLHLEQLLLPP